MLSRSIYNPSRGLTALRYPATLSLLALVFVCGAAWVYTIMGIGMPMSAISMTSMPSDMPMPAQEWTAVRAGLMFLMWWVMMIAMMIPSALPMIFLYDRVAARSLEARRHLGLFVTGYILVWGLFSVIATALHALGETTEAINGMMASSSSSLSAGLLIAAGGWHLTNTKMRCLEACRSPAAFLSRIWKSGANGAVQMGLAHGLYCVGCCWVMMLLLFVGGVMNLYWIVGLSAFVVIEKVMPYSPIVGRLIGLTLIGSGIILLV